MTRILRARHVAPMSAPTIRDGCVVVAGGRIQEVGPTAQIRPGHIDEEIDGVLMPGLINAHTHLELSDCSPGEPPADFGQWLLRLVERSIRIGPMSPETIAGAVGAGVEQCLRFGVTTIGDIAKHAPLVRPVLQDLPIRAVSFGEVQAMAGRRDLLHERFAAATETARESDRLHIGVTPHAPYSVEPPGYQRCLAWAAEQGRPITTHLAETLDEERFLRDHEGALREVWRIIGTWDDEVPRFAGTAIQYAHDLGLLQHPVLLAHVNYATDVDLDLLAAGRAAVVWCPRTHRYFGHPSHRWREMRARGITLCIGTDSCASSPDLNIVDDLRLIRQQAPDESAEAVWALVTTEAARALRWPRGSSGSIGAGAPADLVTFPTRSGDPLREILDTPGMLPTGTWIGGERVA